MTHRVVRPLPLLCWLLGHRWLRVGAVNHASLRECQRRRCGARGMKKPGGQWRAAEPRKV
jgi:hypothetical protein